MQSAILYSSTHLLMITASPLFHRPIFNIDFLQDLPMVCFVVTQHSESERFR